MTQTEHKIILSSGNKYVASTDTQQIHDDGDGCLMLKDSKVQLQLRL